MNFRDGVNGISAYNNADTGAVQIVHWVNGASSIQAPSKSPNVLAVKYVGGNTSPNYGGFILAHKQEQMLCLSLEL